MFTDQERQEIIAVKERLLKLVESRFMPPNSIPTAIHGVTMNGILTGGAIASTFHNEKPNDYDIYFRTDEEVQAVAQMFLDPSMHQWISSLKHNYIQPRVPGHYYTNNAITLINGIQFIILQTANLRDLFDMIHCQPWLDLKERTLHISEAQYRAIKAKQLIRNPAGPTPQGRRLKKYLDRGWHIRNDDHELKTQLTNYLVELDLAKTADDILRQSVEHDFKLATESIRQEFVQSIAQQYEGNYGKEYRGYKD